VSAHSDWCRANGVLRDTTAGGRRTLLRLELEGLGAVAERATRNAKHAPTEKDREKALARADAILYRIVQLNDELQRGDDAGGPSCQECDELFRDREQAWELGYLCHRCTPQPQQKGTVT
jgi:hypothetical protein